MSYVEIAPLCPQLRPFIECFWISQFANQSPKRIAPDGGIDLIYPLSSLTSGAPVPVLVGTMTRWLMTMQPSCSDIVGIRFRPGGIYPFLKMPLHAFTDVVVPLDDIVPSLGTAFLERVQEMIGETERLSRIEQILSEKLRQYDRQWLPMLPVAAHIASRHGQISVTQLSEQANLSRRQLERLFQQYVGVSPKLLARILRFRYVKNALRRNSQDSLMAIAFDHGYTDHAHLTKEFKTFLGLTPSIYFTR